AHNPRHYVPGAVVSGAVWFFRHPARARAPGGPEAVTPESIREVYGMDAYVEQVRGIPTVIPK
ncbi:MAG: hypothetical protein LBT41_05425, partial [Candidatus Methanoplasma sp.]|nr:hypothetical protein [Candidatus Methanoplasma sp.]